MSEPFADMLDYQRKMVEMVELATGVPKVFLGVDLAYGNRSATAIAVHEAATGRMVSTVLVDMQQRLNDISNLALDIYRRGGVLPGTKYRELSRKEMRRRRYFRHYAFVGRRRGRV